MAYKANEIRKMITDLVGDAKTLRAKAHEIMVICLDHYRQTGNLSLFADLSNRTHRTGLNRRAMNQWIQRYARANLVVVEGSKVKFTKKEGADHKTVDVDKAAASPFYDDESLDGRTGDDLKKFNFWGRIRSDIKRQRELMAAIKENGGDVKKAGYDPDKTTADVDTSILDKFEAMVESYGNLDKPLPKNDRTVFRGSHGADANLKAVDDDTPQAATA